MPVLFEASQLSGTITTDFGRQTLFENLSFTLNPGQTLGIVGPSGVGKSCLVRYALLRLSPPASLDLSGQVYFQSAEISRLNSEEMLFFRGRMSWIPQETALSLPAVFTAGEALCAVAALKEREFGSAKQRAEALLSDLNFSDPRRIMESYPHELSGGQLQRMILALSLINQPDILFADEPTSAQDLTLRQVILEKLQYEQESRGMALVLVSHDGTLIEQMCDQVIELKTTAQLESPPDLREQC